MIPANPIQTHRSESLVAQPVRYRHSICGKEATILTNIYQEDTNIVIWQRELSATLQADVSDFLAANPTLRISLTVSPQSVLSSMSEVFGAAGQSGLRNNIAELVDLFCDLFELKRVGLRLTVLDCAMCPRFHVDRVPCRLITTYQGIATEWLPHQVVDRSKLGTGNNGKPDAESGLFRNERDIQQLHSGDVALLKGELWQGNENAGLVHRSPTPSIGTSRLLLTLDFVM